MTKRKASGRYGSGQHVRGLEDEQGLVHPPKDEEYDARAAEWRRREGLAPKRGEFDYAAMAWAAERNRQRLGAPTNRGVTVGKRQRKFKVDLKGRRWTV
jgi:hypothetical protein